MNSIAMRMLFLAVLLLGIVHLSIPTASAEDIAAIRAKFADPPREFATAPLWVWNDLLTEEQIRSTLQDLAGQKVKQAFVHPRPGLMTPYLSDDWFRLWKVALDEAEKLDMNIWIYDENSYPSGFAGGLVPDAMPESRGKGLVIREVDGPPKLADDIVAVFRPTGDGYENVTARIRAGDELPGGKYLIGSVKLAPSSGWFGGKYYVDLLRPGVTEKFLEITMGAYQRELGEHFGKRLPGVFTDEPHLAPAGGLHWSDHLPELFEKRWGYSLIDNLPGLVRPVGDWRRVRHNYYQLLLEQFIDRWAKPCYQYCEDHDLEFTGHYWEHGWPGAGHGGDNMAMYAWHHRPAIDTLMNRYSEDVHAQFGNVRAVLELASVANQLGRERTLCEAYGAGGWDLRFEDMKRIGDWLYVLGVNTLDEHLSYITIRGARKRDHPQSFSYHEPWWESYHVMAEYFTRLSLVMSRGNEINHILVLEPTTTSWMLQGDGQLGPLGNSFQKLVTDLAKAQVEFDLGCEDIIARHGSVGRWKVLGERGEHIGETAPWLRIGRRDYSVVVLPPGTENLNGPTIKLLEEFTRKEGRVICCGPPPTRVDGQASDRGAKLVESPRWQQLPPEALSDRLLELSGDTFTIQRVKDDRGILFHQRRRVARGEFLLLVNTSIEAPCSGEVRATAAGLQQWDLRTGTVGAYPFTKDSGRIEAPFQLPPCGSLLLFLSHDPIEPADPVRQTAAAIAPVGPIEILRQGPNVLALDFVDVTAGEQTRKNVHFYAANTFAFRQNGTDGDPWDRAVQFRDEMITKKFPPDSGFEATYRFIIATEVPEPLHVVVERPDLYTITCNGKPVEAEKDAWWLDKCFGKIDITSAARVGKNEITIKASPMTVRHELEPAYVLGGFRLDPTESGFVIVPDRPLQLAEAGWNRQGHPFHGAGVAYARKFEVTDTAGAFHVELGHWRGSVARVVVNGKKAGHIAYQPWSLEVTEHVVAGTNTIEVVVIGTLKNTLGPHHAGTAVGAAWPHAFQQAPEHGPPPGAKYHTLDYGLFEAFSLKRVKTQ